MLREVSVALMVPLQYGIRNAEYGIHKTFPVFCILCQAGPLSSGGRVGPSSLPGAILAREMRLRNSLASVGCKT